MASVNPSPRTRKHLYKVAVAVGAYVAVKGLATHAEIDAVLGVAGAALGITAHANVDDF